MYKLISKFIDIWTESVLSYKLNKGILLRKINQLLKVPIRQWFSVTLKAHIDIPLYFFSRILTFFLNNFVAWTTLLNNTGVNVSFCQSTITKCHRLCGSKNSNSFSHNSEDQRFQIKDSTGLEFSEASQWLANSLSSLCRDPWYLSLYVITSFYKYRVRLDQGSP